MRLEIAHDLSMDEARRVAAKVVTGYVERFSQYAPEVKWLDADHVHIQLAVRGFGLEGSMVLQPGVLIFEASVPLLLRPLAGRAKEVIEAQVQLWVDRVRRGEL